MGDRRAPAWSAFPPALLCGRDEEESAAQAAFCQKLYESAAERGVETVICELNAAGHELVEAPCNSAGWRIWREPGADGERDLQISHEPDSGDFMITTPMTDAAWQRMIDVRKQGLSAAELAAEARREAFYQRAAALSARHGEGAPLDARDTALLALYTLEAEVHNGGFVQYFGNTGGAEAATALQTLQEIGAVGAAGLLARAMELVPAPYEETLSDAQWDRLETERTGLGALDDEFYALEEDLPLLFMRE